MAIVGSVIGLLNAAVLDDCAAIPASGLAGFAVLLCLLLLLFLFLLLCSSNGCYLKCMCDFRLPS